MIERLESSIERYLSNTLMTRILARIFEKEIRFQISQFVIALRSNFDSSAFDRIIHPLRSHIIYDLEKA